MVLCLSVKVRGRSGGECIDRQALHDRQMIIAPMLCRMIACGCCSKNIIGLRDNVCVPASFTNAHLAIAKIQRKKSLLGADKPRP
jgi:hypothetical protein